MSGARPRSLRWTPPLGTPEDAAARLAPFVASGALEPGEAHAAARLAVVTGEASPDVVLALALALRAARRGDVCVALDGPRAVDAARLLRAERAEADDAAPAAPEIPTLPEDRGAWRERIARSPAVVGPMPDDPAASETWHERALFVIDGARLYTARAYRDERFLAERLVAMAAEPPAEPPDPVSLRATLGALFPGRGTATAGGRGVDRQAAAVAAAAFRKLTVLTGGPGTGKTRTVLFLVAVLWVERERRRAAGKDGDPGPLRAALAAPTGKAAARMRESMLRDAPDVAAAVGTIAGIPAGVDSAEREDAAGRFLRFVRSLEGRTLHRTLGWLPGGGFRHGPDRPLPFDLIVVDETSMVDLSLVARLAAAVPSAARLVFLGDPHQLASVGAGTVLADLAGDEGPTPRWPPTLVVAVEGAVAGRIEGTAATAGVPSGLSASLSVLVESRRFPADAPVARFANACLAGDPDEAAAVLETTAADPTAGSAVDAGRGLLWTRMPGPGEPAAGRLDPIVLARAVEAYATTVRQARGDATASESEEQRTRRHRRAIDALSRFRLLAPHRGGPLGVAALNRFVVRGLSERVGAESQGAPVPAASDRAARERLARLGARALGLDRPDWVGRPILVTENDYRVRASDGHVGLFNGDVGIVVERRGRRAAAFPGPDPLPDGGACDAGGGRAIVRYYPIEELPPHETVFATTVHKAQGSEFDRTVLVLPGEPTPLLSRELLYTGATRARPDLWIVGSAEVIRAAVASVAERTGGLRARIWGEGGRASR